MVLDDVRGLVEPEFAERGEHMALFGDRVGHDHIESADAVGGHDEQRVAEVEDFAHLATAQLLDARQVDLGNCVGHGSSLEFLQ